MCVLCTNNASSRHFQTSASCTMIIFHVSYIFLFLVLSPYNFLFPNSHLYAFMCCYYLKSGSNRWGKVQCLSFWLCLVLWTWWSPFPPISIINNCFPFSWCTNHSTKHTPSHIICPLVCWLALKLISWFDCWEKSCNKQRWACVYISKIRYVLILKSCMSLKLDNTVS